MEKELKKVIKEKFDINKIYYEIDSNKDYLFLSIKSVEPYQSILIVNINLKDNEKEVLKQLIKCIKEFDFSFTLEFNSLEELINWNN